jgi:hypothetical protein
MKAQFVYENLGFERGLSPKEALKIGADSLLKDYEYQNIWTTQAKEERKITDSLINGKIYILGDNDLNYERGEYLELIQKILDGGNILKEIHLTPEDVPDYENYDHPESFVRLYDTEIGKIIEIETPHIHVGGDKSLHNYLGDVEAAMNLEIYKKPWIIEDY